MKRIELLGFRFISATFNDVLTKILEGNVDPSEGYPFVITPNADQVLQFNENQDLKSFFEKSAFILPDGFPIIAYSKFIGRPLAGRLAGSDLFPMIWKLIIKEKKNVFVIAPNEATAGLLKKEYPSLVCHVPGMLNVNDKTSFEKETDAIVAKLRSQSFNYILIGLGFPKQEMLTRMIYERQRDQHTIFMLLGASFEFYLGLKKRAPVWIRKVGFEWLHRLSQEPGRLWKRYTVGNIKFMFFFLKSYFKERE